MQDNAVTSGSAEDWLRHAEADLVLAEVPLPKGGMYRSLCFHAQQAAEKAIKAVLISRGIEFPKTHAIAYLIGLLPAGERISKRVREAARLTSYATTFRYPAATQRADVTKRQYRAAIRLAQITVDWAKTKILKE